MTNKNSCTVKMTSEIGPLTIGNGHVHTYATKPIPKLVKVCTLTTKTSSQSSKRPISIKAIHHLPRNLITHS